MSAELLDGRAGAVVKADLRERIVRAGARGSQPGLRTVLVGVDPGRRAPVRGRHCDCAEVAIVSVQGERPTDAAQAEFEPAGGSRGA